MKPKVVLIHNIIYPPRIPLFNQIAQNKNIDFKALFLAPSMRGRLLDEKDFGQIKFNYQILPRITIPLKGADFFQYLINPTIVKELKRENPDVIVSFGWAYPANLAALFYSKAKGKKFILWSESTAYEQSWRRRLSLPLVKLFVRLADNFIVPGTRAREYLESLGAKRRKIFVAQNAIDNQFFAQKSKLSRQERKTLREKFGIGKDKKVILFVGRLEKVKNLDTLLEAFETLQKEKKDFALVFVGQGTEEKRLKEICRQRNIKDVFFAGLVERHKLPAVYGASDLLVLPSVNEVWGYVLNEAMASGLPVICSKNVGASADLVKEGVNGFIFSPQDAKKLAEKVAKVKPGMGRNSKKIIAGITYNKMVKVFEKALGEAVMVKVFFRDDDVEVLTEPLEKVVFLFIKKKIPISLGVVPVKVDKQTVSWLKRIKRKNGELIQIDQHGFSHTRQGKGEFNKPKELKKGNDLMRKYFGENFSEIFTLPWQFTNHRVVKELERLGYKAISGNHRLDWTSQFIYKIGRKMRLISIFGRRISYQQQPVAGLKIKEMSTSLDLAKDYNKRTVKSLKESLEEFASHRGKTNVLGVLVHHALFDSDAKMKMLEKFLDTLKKDPYISFKKTRQLL